jgi:hypothetical protein
MATQVRQTTSGYKIGTSASQTLAFHGATPVAQRAGSAQAAVAATGTTVSTPNGSDAATTQTLANALKTAVNANITDIAAIVVLLNEVRAALVAKGLIKGAA